MTGNASPTRRFHVRTADGAAERDIDPSSVSAGAQGNGTSIQVAGERATHVQIGTDLPTGPGGRRIEVVVDGWRFELDVEDARRAALREAGTRHSADPRRDGPFEVRAIIPGRVAAVSVAAGDRVVAGQTLLLIEAMKMQNELRAPRDGVVDRLAVGMGETIDLGQLLVVLA